MHDTAAERVRDLAPLRQFAAHSPVPTLLLAGPEHRLLYVNAAFAAVVARPAAELCGRPAAEAFPSLAAAGHLVALDRVRETGEPFRRGGLPMQFSSGQPPRFWDVEATPLDDATLLLQLREATMREAVLRQGEAAQAVLAAILGAVPAGGVLPGRPSRRIRPDEASPSAEPDEATQFHHLAEAMPHCVWQTDAAGMLEYVNRRWCDCTGLTLEASRDGRWAQALHPKDRRRLVVAWSEARDRVREYEVDVRLRHAEAGTWRWFRVRGAPVLDAEGVIRHWVGTCTDVEEMHQAAAAAQDALVAEQSRWREADHRIRNSLQLVAALLRLQAGRAEAAPTREALAAATTRVQVVAEAHRALETSGDQHSIRLAGLLRELAGAATLQHAGADLRVEVPSELRLDAKRAVPLALLLAELVGGVLRQRPEGGRHGSLRLSVGAVDGRLRATLQGQDEATPMGLPTGGLGDAVLRAMARQLGALLWQDGNAVAGYRLLLEMPLEPPEPSPARPAEPAG